MYDILENLVSNESYENQDTNHKLYAPKTLIICHFLSTNPSNNRKSLQRFLSFCRHLKPEFYTRIYRKIINKFSKIEIKKLSILKKYRKFHLEIIF